MRESASLGAGTGGGASSAKGEAELSMQSKSMLSSNSSRASAKIVEIVELLVGASGKVQHGAEALCRALVEGLGPVATGSHCRVCLKEYHAGPEGLEVGMAGDSAMSTRTSSMTATKPPMSMSSSDLRTGSRLATIGLAVARD